ncbi:MAG: hypothetical protein ABEI98_07240 [Halorhabdus sp.]
MTNPTGTPRVRGGDVGDDQEDEDLTPPRPGSTDAVALLAVTGTTRLDALSGLTLARLSLGFRGKAEKV